MRDEPAHHDELLASEAALDEALAWARESTAPLWHLAIASYRMVAARRYLDALRVFDVILDYRTLHLSAYCNALWVVQEDNTGLPQDAERARRYLQRCLIHASMNPDIHQNAAGVLVELGEFDAAMDQLFAAAYREVKLGEIMAAPLLEPLRRHPRWTELESLCASRSSFAELLREVGAQLEGEVELDGRKLARRVSAEHTFAALEAALDSADPRLRHRAVQAISR